MAAIEEIKRDLTGISISRAKALIALAKSKKEFPDTNDIREATGFNSTKLGGMGSALTKIKINGKLLLSVRPVRLDRNTTQYIWNKDVATRKQILKVLEEFGILIK